MGLTTADVRRLAELARIALDDDEAATLAAQLGDILGRIDALEPESDTGVAAVPGGAGTPLRSDEPGVDPLAAEPAALAPEWRDGFFTVPRLASHRDGTGEEGA